MSKFRWLFAIIVAVALAPAALAAQGRTVTGRVTHAETQQPLAGVQVVAKGTTAATRTDASGNFTLNVPAGATALTFTSLGYTAREVPITGSQVSVTLNPSAVALEGVVVTALGIERQERTLGIAAQAVSGEDLSRVETNIVNAFSGKVAGVDITNSGPQGGSSRIVIRGENSITGSNDPLFVVDGVPIDNYKPGLLNTGQGGFDYGNAVQDINPNDIESVTVLKGPNAAALYGSRASNGAVIITTKKGRAGRAQISASQQVTWESELKLPKYQNAYGQGYRGSFEYYDGANNGVYDGEDVSWGPPLDVGLNIPQFDSPIVNGVRQPTPWISHPNNVDDFFRTGNTLNTNVSVAAGTERMQGRFGFSRLAQDGMLPGFELGRTTLSFGGGMDATDRLNLNTSLQYVTSDGQNRPGVGYDEDNPMSQFIWFGRQVNVQELGRRWQEIRGPEDPMAGYPFGWNYLYHPNPYFLQLGNHNFDDRNRLIGQISATYKFTPWLNAMVRTGTDWYQDGRMKTYAAKYNKISGLYTTNPLTLEREYVGENGAFGSWDIGFQETNTDFLLVANPELGLPFSTNFTFGGNRRDFERQTNYNWVGDLATPGIFDVSNAAITPDPYTFLSRKRVNSLYGQAEFGYNDYLFLTVTGRNDWSSTLPKENNSYFYPSVSSSFVFSDAIPVLAASNWLNYGKLRASWARVGNDTDPYQLINTFTADQIFNGLPTFTIPGRLKNANLKPESTESYEVGTELSFFNDRLGLDATYYNEKTFDQIMPVEISRATGYTSRLINAGTVQNKGVELLLRGTPVQAGDFRWETSLTWSKNNSTVVDLAEGIEGLEMSTGDFWGVQVFARKGEPFGQLVGKGFQRDPQGNVVISSTTGRPLRDETPKVLGNFNPDWRGGWSNELSYRGMRLGFLLDTKQGGEIYSVTQAFGRYAGILDETVAGRCSRPADITANGGTAPQGYPACSAETGIVLPGVNRVVKGADTTYVANSQFTDAQSLMSTYFNIPEANIMDASYVKLRELTFAFGIPNRLTSRLGLSGLDVQLIGRNLFLWTDNKHLDPESAFDASNVQGFEYGQMPSARSIGFNITVRP